MLARLRILDAESAETIDMHGVLDDVIDSVPQEPGVDKDIRAGVLYTLARESRDLGQGFMLSLSGVKVRRDRRRRSARASRFSRPSRR